jgi:peptide/nickel transport system substrate-binding protein
VSDKPNYTTVVDSLVDGGLNRISGRIFGPARKSHHLSRSPMPPSDDNLTNNGINAELTRRRLLEVGGAGVLTVGLGSVLAACGGTNTAATSAATAAAAGTPRRGGTLRIGVTGGGTADTLDAQQPNTTVDFLRVGMLYDQLMIMDPATAQPDYALAELVEANPSATEWTIRVRPDVTFHDGRPLSSKDVLFSLQRIFALKLTGTVSIGPMNLPAAKIMDSRTLRIPYHAPFSVLPDGLADVITIRIVPVGYDPKTPIGTGPFRYQSFTPGTQSTFARFDDYWQPGLPYLDRVEVIDFADETAQVNALQAGQVDLIDQLSYPSVAAVKGNGGKVLVSKTVAFVPFTMRVDTPPFNDVRVRQALRLAVDRPQFNDALFGGLGSIGNDIYGAIDPAYKSIPQREQDIEQAKSLLRSAGQSDLTVTLYSAATGPAAEAGASVFASQAKAAGITVNIATTPTTTFWAQDYTKVPFALSYWNALSYLIASAQGLAKGATFNEIHQNDAYWQSLFNDAIRTLDSGKREEIVKEMMMYDWNNGGYIIPVYFPTIEGMATNVFGDSDNITGQPINGSNGSEYLWLKS